MSRLEEIKKQFLFWIEEDELIGISPEDIEWIIQQAERMEGLEKLCKQLIGEEWMNDEGLYDSEMMKLEKENQRYKQAVDGLEERNSFLERAHRTNINIAEHALEERDRYKKALERIRKHSSDRASVFIAEQALAGDTE